MLGAKFLLWVCCHKWYRVEDTLGGPILTTGSKQGRFAVMEECQSIPHYCITETPGLGMAEMLKSVRVGRAGQ